MLEGKIYITGIKQVAVQQNSAQRQQINKNNRQTTQQADFKSKCAGGVCSMDWRPIPTFYRSAQS
jgi:hypothetical protein